MTDQADSRVRQILDPAFERFADLLDKRFVAGAYTTEDAVRYTLFSALVAQLELAPHQIILEKPHPRIARAKIDTYIPLLLNRALAIEYKYDRPIPSGTNLPKPQKAGAVIYDLFRLARFEIEDRVDGVFVYLTASEMADYLRNVRNGLLPLFELGRGERLLIDDNFLAERSQTLQNAAGVVTPCQVEGVMARAVSNGHELRVYLVTPVSRTG